MIYRVWIGETKDDLFNMGVDSNLIRLSADEDQIRSLIEMIGAFPGLAVAIVADDDSDQEE